MDEIERTCKGKILHNAVMSDYTTVGIGGLARNFVVVHTEEELIQIINLAQKHKTPYVVIGSGSNLLISDEPIDGLIIKNEITGISQNDNTVTVKSGTLLQELVDFNIQHGLSGIQKMTGIPGTVAGAIYGNAGAYGQTISDFLIGVTILEEEQTVKLDKECCHFSYRSSLFKDSKQVILEAEFSFTPGDSNVLQQEATETLNKRLEKYPPGLKCPGSFFKNIPVEDIPTDIFAKLPPKKDTYGKVPAGALLEEVGAKGQQLGQAKIADYHANLFINLGQARASDFYQLAQTYAQKVKDQFGINLEPEVQFINLPPLKVF